MDDRCYYASMQQTSQDGSSVTKRFKHGCINNKDCSNTANIFDECTSSTSQCEVRCCSENLCNKGNVRATINNINLIYRHKCFTEKKLTNRKIRT